MRFWASAHQTRRLKSIQSVGESSLVFSYSFAFLFHNWSTFFIWPMVLWNVWIASVRLLQALRYLFALPPSLSEKLHYSKRLIKSKNSSIQVRQDGYDFVGERFEYNQCFFRSWVSKIKKIIRENQSAGRTREWSCFHANNENIAAMCNAANDYCQLCHLLCHPWFEECFTSIAISNVVNSYFQITKVKLDWNLCLLQRFPFDVSNPIGYSMAVIHEYIICGYEFYVITCVLPLALAVFWYTISITKELHRILKSIDASAQDKVTHSSELKTLFSEFIDTYASIKQLSRFYLEFLRK